MLVILMMLAMMDNVVVKDILDHYVVVYIPEVDGVSQFWPQCVPCDNTHPEAANTPECNAGRNGGGGNQTPASVILVAATGGMVEEKEEWQIIQLDHQ